MFAVTPTRTLAFAVSAALTPQNLVDSDVAYYRAWGEWATTNGGLAQAMREYPTPAALLLWLPTFFTAGDTAYRVVFVAGMVVMAVLGLVSLLTLPERAATRAATGASAGASAAGTATIRTTVRAAATAAIATARVASRPAAGATAAPAAKVK